VAIDPTREAIQRFATEGPDGPFVMLNLLRFAENGRARYAEYSAGVVPLLAGVGGEVVYFGAAAGTLIAEPGSEWDAVLLVRYPDRAAFLRLVGDPRYQAIVHLRSEALADSVLQVTLPWRPS
jgi:uncharacterized protein (DUF1330 family)